ncbi:hypothetical protein CBM2599_B20229 [Cupriavidus taiwanensis]|nr:hypothetical protein CBM2599_B20229 [Cupriavidus taiwanensis]SOY98716.1 hypothetical protein CBM2600_B30226 [Cupriavidus taiwanensis]
MPEVQWLPFVLPEQAAAVAGVCVGGADVAGVGWERGGDRSQPCDLGQRRDNQSCSLAHPRVTR